MILRRPDHATIEERTQTIGRELAERMDRRGPLPLSSAWFDDLILRWASADEATKVQLFRFVDVLPTLTSPDRIASEFRTYFDPFERRYPWPIRLTSWAADPGRWTHTLMGRLITFGSSRMARQFVAGSTPEEIAAVLRRQWDQGLASTLDVLGEATVTPGEADAYAEQYLVLLERLVDETRRWPARPILEQHSAGPIPRVNLSIKVSALNSRFDPIDPAGSIAGVLARLRPILRRARRLGAHINLDMEHYAYKNTTLALFHSLLSDAEFVDWPDMGLALQAYLRDAERDLTSLIDAVRRRGTPVTLRLVKGAYWDYETVLARQRGWPIPVFIDKSHTDASFERCTRLLLENAEWTRPAIASHNLRSIAHALAVADHLDVPKSDIEFQMLFGMAEPFRRALAEQERRLRIYTPYGQILPGMAYLVRRLLENSSNVSFLNQTLRGGRAVEECLLAPSRDRQERPAMVVSHPVGRETPLIENEPVADFSRRTERDSLAHALANVRTQLGREYRAWIAGQWVDAQESLTRVNPSLKREVIGRVASCDANHADLAVVSAADAFLRWSRQSPAVRAELVRQIGDSIRRHRFEWAAWQVLEVGKPWREADADVCEAIDFCEYYAESALMLGQERHRREPGEDNSYRYKPRGVAVAIAPWNFPLAILVGMTVGPLAAGCTVVVKPAEQASVLAARFFQTITDEVDLPTGVLHFVPGVGEVVGARLVEHPAVSVVSFTGSRAVGLNIIETAARTPVGQHHVKSVLAEMGGKNAVIVDDDADLDEAVLGVVQSAFGFSGQKCSACSRVIVLPHVREAFTARLIDAARAVVIGPAENPANTMGPVIDEDAHRRLFAVLEHARREGLTVEAGPATLSDGYFIEPHIILNASPKHRLAQEEFFGPILTLLPADSMDEAIAIANDTDYALTGGIYSRNPRHIEQVRDSLDVGNLYINRKITGAEVDRHPFGGHKLSGTGSKAGGPDYLRHFLIAQTITENTIRRGFAPQDD